MNPKFTQKRRLTRGFTLVEFSIVLGVMGIVMGGIWVLASRMYDNVKHEKFSEMLTTITGNIRGFNAGRAFIETIAAETLTVTLKKRDVFPGDMVRTGVAGVDTPFGLNSLNVCGWAATGQTACIAGASTLPFFAIEVLLSRRDCINVVMRNSSAVAQPGLTAVYSNGALRAFPFDLASAGAACGNANNTVDFVYRLMP